MADACEGCAVSVLAEGSDLACHEDIETEAAHPCEDAWIGSDARLVFAHGDVTRVMGGILDRPMRADGPSGASGDEWLIGDIEGGFVGLAEQPGCRIACGDRALDPDDRGDMGVPIGACECVGRAEDRDDPGFIAIAAVIAAVGGIVRRDRRGEAFDRAFQGRLIVLDLNDQSDFGGLRDLEEFF